MTDHDFFAAMAVGIPPINRPLALPLLTPTASSRVTPISPLTTRTP